MLEFRPLTEADHAALKAMCEQSSVRRWGWKPDDVGGDDTATQFAILVDGEIAGLIQYGEEPYPDYRHAWIDVFLGDGFQGRGLGTEAVRRMRDILIEEHGHHRITIDPAVDNQAAYRAYEKAGFRTVGVTEAAWRDPDGVWQDAVLMEYVRLP